MSLMLVFVLALAGSCQRKPAEGPPAAGSAADSAQQARLAAGQTAYLANCAMCHGVWGLGDGPLAAQLQKESGVKPAHLNDLTHLESMGRAGVITVIEQGGAHTGRSNLMPPWGERLSTEEIEKIADFVLALPDLHPKIPPKTLAKYLQAPPGATAEGRTLYVTMCTACHGPSGKGDGPYADTMLVRNKLRPRDLTDSLYFSGKTDRELFATISLGGGYFHKSPFMPIWSVSLTPDQIKDLVSYIRALSRTTPQP
ncbi:MAG TPA: c-type cytochrome [Candidatus Eisenbacteria bacterium]|nr:c-type cytochrome [Candidatus Eisenbacteria bacterium]